MASLITACVWGIAEKRCDGEQLGGDAEGARLSVLLPDRVEESSRTAAGSRVPPPCCVAEQQRQPLQPPSAAHWRRAMGRRGAGQAVLGVQVWAVGG